MNELNFSLFCIEMVQPRFVRAEKQSARVQHAVDAYNSRVAARVATQTSKSQSASILPSLEVALTDVIETLAAFKGVLAESEGWFPPACREPEQGNGRGGRGNASGSGDQDVVQQPGLSELIAELARSAAGPGGSAGGVDKSPWSILWESSTICVPGAGEAAMASSSTA